MENGEKKPILVLALGNDLLGDDAVGLLAARKLEEAFADRIDVELTSESGLALIEFMTGYQRVLLIDAVATGAHPPGTVIEFALEDLGRVIAPSPHYAGIPEVFEVARQHGVEMPHTLCILGLEVNNPQEFREGLTPVVEQALPALVERSTEVLACWLELYSI